MSALLVRFTRLNPTHHRLEVVRPGGTRWARELETRSVLLHDLVHFAVESEAGLTQSFYGGLAAGLDYDDPTRATPEARLTEIVVGSLQSAIKEDVSSSAFAARMGAIAAQMEGETPPWLTAAFVDGARERLRRLQGQWKATPFGETMELRFAL